MWDHFNLIMSIVGPLLLAGIFIGLLIMYLAHNGRVGMNPIEIILLTIVCLFIGIRNILKLIKN